jgi:hypothetical protein
LHEISEEKSVDCYQAVEELLNEHLNLKSYGDEIDYLFFVFLIHLPNQKFTPNITAFIGKNAIWISNSSSTTLRSWPLRPKK